MKIKKIVAVVLCTALVTLTFAACSNTNPPDNSKVAETPPDTLVIDGESTEEVTAITGATDSKGNVIDAEGITDVSGHKVYYTGYDTDEGKKIYTTGKKDNNGNILYTLNSTDDRGNQTYFTGTVVDGKLELDKTNSIPDYTHNNNSTLDTNTRYTSTSTVKYSAVEIEEKASDIRKTAMLLSSTKGDDIFRKIIPAEKGGFIAISYSMSKTGIYEGASKSFENFGTIMKISDSGDVEWKYFVGGDANIDLYDVTQLKDGSIVAVGYTLATDTDAPINSYLYSGLIVKVSDKGEYMWSYSFPGNDDTNGEYIQSVCATPDGGFVAGGRADSNAGLFSGTQADHFKAFLFKFDRRGNIEWRKTLSGSKGNTFEAIDVNDDGDIFATCVTLSNDGSFTSFKGYGITANTVVVKFQKDGKLLWSRNLMSSGLSEFKAIDATEDGGCIVGGRYSIAKKADGSFSISYGLTDGYVVKYDANGGVCWSRIIGGKAEDEITAIKETPNGIVVVGKTKSADLDFSGTKNLGENDGFVMVLDNAGKTLCTSKIAGSGEDLINGLAVSESGFAIVGFTRSTDDIFNKNTTAKTATGFFAKYDFVID